MTTTGERCTCSKWRLSTFYGEHAFDCPTVSEPATPSGAEPTEDVGRLSEERARAILREYPDADLSAFDVDGDPDELAADEAGKTLAAIAAKPTDSRATEDVRPCPECGMVVAWPDGGRGLHTDDCPHASGADDDMEARALDYAEQEITRWPPSDAKIEAHLVAFARAEVELAVRQERERLLGGVYLSQDMLLLADHLEETARAIRCDADAFDAWRTAAPGLPAEPAD